MATVEKPRTSESHTSRRLPKTPVGCLPPRMRVLVVSGSQRPGVWLAEAFAADSASEVVLEEAVGAAAGMTRLRDEVYDAVLLSHVPGEVDALEILDGLRAGSVEQPIIVFGNASQQEMEALCLEAGADAYVCTHTTTTRTVIWQVARAVERHHLIAENRRLSGTQQQRLRQEHDEAQRLLAQQRELIATAWTGMTANEKPSCPAPTAAMVAHYRELMRAYVIMGSGSLAAEMTALEKLFAANSLTPQQTLALHLDVLEEMIRDLGSRSARHVINRADLMILQVMMHLAQQNASSPS